MHAMRNAAQNQTKSIRTVFFFYIAASCLLMINFPFRLCWYTFKNNSFYVSCVVQCHEGLPVDEIFNDDNYGNPLLTPESDSHASGFRKWGAFLWDILFVSDIQDDLVFYKYHNIERQILSYFVSLELFLECKCCEHQCFVVMHVHPFNSITRGHITLTTACQKKKGNSDFWAFRVLAQETVTFAIVENLVPDDMRCLFLLR